MRAFDPLIISLVAVATVNARPQEDHHQPTTPTTPPADASNNFPGFCPSAISQDTDTHGKGSGDCRCGQSLGLQVANAETNAVQPLAAAPDWKSGGNCGCLWEQNQCGCYDGVSGSDGWLYGGYGGGNGGDNNNRCTVSVTQTVPSPAPEPTIPGECGSGDRYCTVTVTVSEPGQPVTVPGQPLPPVTVTVPGPGQPEPTTVTVAVPVPSEPSESRTTSTIIESSRPGQSGTTRPTTTSFSATGGGGGSSSESTSTSRPTIVTVNAAAIQTGVMALGAMFGGAAMLVNM